MYRTGDIVISKAGHDEGRIYVVAGQKCDDFVLVVDGRYRKVSNPKIKRNKHIRWLKANDELHELISGGMLTDAHVVCALRAGSIVTAKEQ